MGKYLRPGTDSCWDFKPDDTDTELYIEADHIARSLPDLLERISEKWPGIKPEEIEIEPKYIHTYALGYDRYDPSDYTNYLLITRKEAK